MGWLTKKVKTTFIDDETGSTIGVTKMVAEDLPETFEVQTTMHISDVEWEVVSASPQTRIQYAKSKCLTLRLRKIEWNNPASILYSLPSICDGMPALGDKSVSTDDCVLHEDDWRQLELVARQHTEEIEVQILAIRQIHEHHSVDVGWNSVHCRGKPDPPIPASFDVQDICRFFGSNAPIRGVTYTGAQTTIATGFSIKPYDGLTLYGLSPDGGVTVLGIVNETRATVLDAAIANLSSLAIEYELDLLHWCRCQRAAPSTTAFRDLIM